MFIDKVNKAFLGKDQAIKIESKYENCDEFKLRLSYDSLHYDSIALSALFEIVPQRDKLTIEIIYSDDDSIQIDRSNFYSDYTKRLEKLNDYLEEKETLEVKVAVQKFIDASKVSIYDTLEFCEWFFNKTAEDFFKCCSMLKRSAPNGVLFECIDDNVSLQCGFINFSAVNTLDQNTYRMAIKRDIFARQEVCSIISNERNDFWPDDFHITGVYVGFPDKYLDYVNWIEMLLSLAHLSNQSNFSDNSVLITLKGYRLVEEEIVFQRGKYNPNFYKIYSWTYSAGNLNDKIALVRNLLSLSCKCVSILNVDETVLPAIQSNYNLYIQNNVKDYLALKQTVSTTLQGYCNNVSEAINKYSGGLKSNFIAFLGYIATILFTKGIKKETTEIFTADITVLTSIILAGSFVICLISIMEMLLKHRYFNKVIEGLKAQYSDIMELKELETVIDKNKLLCTAKSNFRWSLGVISVIWIVSIVVLFLLLDFVSGNTKLLFCINLFSKS